MKQSKKTKHGPIRKKRMDKNPMKSRGRLSLGRRRTVQPGGEKTNTTIWRWRKRGRKTGRSMLITINIWKRVRRKRKLIQGASKKSRLERDKNTGQETWDKNRERSVREMKGDAVRERKDKIETIYKLNNTYQK